MAAPTRLSAVTYTLTGPLETDPDVTSCSGSWKGGRNGEEVTQRRADRAQAEGGKSGAGQGSVVRPIAYALREFGLEVWFDEFELKIGDSLRREIDEGLARSRFGIVVLSRAFFDKGWPNYELDGLVTRTVTGEQVLLPIWHNVSKQDVMGYNPLLVDKLASELL